MTERQVVMKPVTDEMLEMVISKVGIPNFGYGPWIAGGLARLLWFNQSWSGHDVDLFFKDHESFKDVAGKLDKWEYVKQVTLYSSVKDKLTNWFNSAPIVKLNSSRIHSSANAVTYTIPFDKNRHENKGFIKVQAINRVYYETFFDIWNDFDFTICNFATDGKILIADKQAIDDCEKNLLTLNKPNYRRLDIKRVLKYSVYGFNADAEILEILNQQTLEGKLLEDWSDEYP